MSERLQKHGHLRLVSDTAARTTVLAVGDVEQWRRRGNIAPGNARAAFVDFHEVSAEILATLQPEMVVSPLLARGFDCIDLAHALHVCGYRGHYRAFARVLPNPTMICAEIRLMYPGLRFDIVEMPAEYRLRAI